jgi:hypothetical protein
MNRASLREDVIERLERAKEHVIGSMLLVADNEDDDSTAANAMRAIVEIEMALGKLRNELQGGDDGDGEPSEISQLAGALASKARPQ